MHIHTALSAVSLSYSTTHIAHTYCTVCSVVVIFDHTHYTYMLHCLQCRCHIRPHTLHIHTALSAVSLSYSTTHIAHTCCTVCSVVVIFDHTHCTYILHCLQCRCHIRPHTLHIHTALSAVSLSYSTTHIAHTYCTVCSVVVIFDDTQCTYILHCMQCRCHIRPHTLHIHTALTAVSLSHSTTHIAHTYCTVCSVVVIFDHTHCAYILHCLQCRCHSRRHIAHTYCTVCSVVVIFDHTHCTYILHCLQCHIRPHTLHLHTALSAVSLSYSTTHIAHTYCTVCSVVVIFDDTHCTYILHCLQCRCHIRSHTSHIHTALSAVSLSYSITHIAHTYCTVCSVVVIFDHTHCSYRLHCLQCRCHILGSFPPSSSLPPWSSVCSQVCNTHTQCTSSVSLVYCSGFPLEVHLTLL